MNYGRNTRFLKYWLITAYKNAAATLISISKECSETEIVQQERVILFIITLAWDYQKYLVIREHLSITSTYLEGLFKHSVYDSLFHQLFSFLLSNLLFSRYWLSYYLPYCNFRLQESEKMSY